MTKHRKNIVGRWTAPERRAAIEGTEILAAQIKDFARITVDALVAINGLPAPLIKDQILDLVTPARQTVDEIHVQAVLKLQRPISRSVVHGYLRQLVVEGAISRVGTALYQRKVSTHDKQSQVADGEAPASPSPTPTRGAGYQGGIHQ